MPAQPDPTRLDAEMARLALKDFRADPEKVARYQSGNLELRRYVDALHAVVAAYGHAGGLVALFTNLRQTVPAGDEGIESLSTHPLTSSRLAAIQAAADQAGWPTQGALTPQAPVLAALRPAAPAVPRP